LRINRAADDAAGLAIAEGFRADVRQLNQESRNLQYGLSAMRTAEGAMQTQQDGTARLRELAVQASNGTLTDDQRQAINQEAQQILEEIDATAQNTEFNGRVLLNGDSEDIPLGTAGDQRISINSSTAADLGIENIDLSTMEGAQQAITALDAGMEQISANRAEIGAQENRLQSAINQRDIASENAAAAESAIRDADFARETARNARDQILMSSGISVLSQSNLLPQQAISLLG